MSDAAPDPEVAAITKVNEALSGLAPEVQQRVLHWAASKFGVTLSVPKKSDTGKENPTNEKEEGNAGGTFTDFASLYDAANPKADAEKALVAGYWVQEIQGNAEWTSNTTNKELKNLGHGITNITGPYKQHIDSSPRLAVRSRLQPIKEVVRMLKRRFENIITYLWHQITNAASESLNAKIQWVKYTARGFRNKQNFINAIYFHCGGLDLAPSPTK